MDYSNILLGQPNQKTNGVFGTTSLLSQAPLTVQGAPNQPSTQLAPKPAPKPVVKPAVKPIKPLAQINDLSGTYGMNNGTVYNKSTGRAFATPDEFFSESGVKSFDGAKFDTNYSPLLQTPQAPQQAPKLNDFSQFKDTTTPEQFLASAANTSSAQQEQAAEQARLFQNYMNAARNQAELSPEEKKAKEELINFQGNTKREFNNLEGQGRGITVGLVRGQQGKLLRDANIQEQTLQERLANVMAENEAKRKAQLSTAELEYNFAKQKAEGQKPIEVSAGSSLIRLNPATGKYEQAYSAPQAPKTEVVNGELVKVNPDGTVTKLYGQPKQDYGTGTIGEYNFYAAQEKAAGRNPMSFNDYQNLDANRKRSIVNVNSGTGGMTSQQATLFNSLAQQQDKSPLIAAADRTIVLKNTIEQIKQNPSDPTLQLNLGYAYIQALDTYQSAVREGELTNLNTIDSQIGQLQNSIAKIQNGQNVRPEVALKIAGAADSIVQAINQGARAKAQSFAARANTLGIGDAWNSYSGAFTPSYSSGGASAGGNIPGTNQADRLGLFN